MPAGKPLIEDMSGRPLGDTLGPLMVGENRTVICRSSGGDPIPNITWWKDSEQMPHVSIQ